MSDAAPSDLDPPSTVEAVGGGSACRDFVADAVKVGPGPPERLDLRGLKCPLPALRTRKALRRLASGRCLDVSASDPLAGIDIPHAAHEEGARVIAQNFDGALWRFLIRRP